MVLFISRLKLRNFKSFKAADVRLPPSFICFAGPNGSGKSNICDSIRFVMGEASLKSLRAKRVRELIYGGAKSAEVTMALESEDEKTRYEIKRAIREDGKVLYRLNGKRATRSAILEALKRHHLDGSGRNTIAQGEVQRIINMNGKERRLIIDSVAGIADFEEKKKEAMRELELVEKRIGDAKLVLGERKTFLQELGREREIALRYQDARKTLANSKGTLVKAELERLEKELEKELKREGELDSVKEKGEQEMAKLEAEIAEVESRRTETSEELQSKQRTNAMIRRLEELKASCSSKEQLIEDKKGFIKSIDAESGAVADELSKEEEAMAALEKDVGVLRSELKEAEAVLEAHGGMGEDAKVLEARKRLEKHERELSSAREKLISLSSEIAAKKEIMEAKREEERRINPPEPKEEAAEDVDGLQKEADRIAEGIEKLFSKTKEINSEIADLDRKMLELKEKASIFKVRSSPHLANPALSFISNLMKHDKGIHGTVADLITFDSKYSAAVEAAAGSRLLYVVVDSVDTATAVIEKLKKAKCGRATFIPLDKVRASQAIKMDGFSSVLDVISFKEKIRPAIDYVFADTLLVKTVSNAKSVGIGKARMVTLEGEIFERSGIVSGGLSQSGILSANQLGRIEKELSDVKSAKDALLQELYSIREEESGLRAKKSQLEITIKTLEMKQHLAEEKRKENAHLLKRREQLEDEIEKLGESLESMLGERKGLEAAVSEKEKGLAILRERLGSAEDEFRKSSEESSKKRAALSGKVSSLRATIEGKTSELELRQKESRANENRLKKLSKDRKEALEKIEEIEKQMKDDGKELVQMEERISSASRTVEKLFERMKGYEDELQELGKKRGTIRLELDKAIGDLNQLNVRKATTTTRLEDMKAEFQSYRDVEFLQLKKDELNRLIRESEQTLSELGNVNMAAIEMYEKKKAEIEDVEGKIEKLDKERQAILSMIGEIEVHKKEAFFETFNAVSENFGNMFDYVNIGRGHLYLNDPSNPFESGLFIKLRRDNQEHSLDALSGGEKTLVALMFIFALQFYKPAPFYILDEVDAALDKPNSKNLAELIAKTSRDSQFILVSHNDTVMANSDSVIGVTKAGGVSKLVGIKLKQVAAA